MKKLINLLAIVVTLSATAYCETGNPTASGVMPQVGQCAVDKINGKWIPFGTKIRIIDQNVGINELVVTDRFGDGRNNCVDLFMESYKKCVEFGRQNMEAEVELP
jgi:3D (Asp-Asp-Asp) domain-containing protein